MSSPSFQDAHAFLAQAAQFQLGVLPTEARHPETAQLSALAQSNLSEALNLLHRIELRALRSLLTHLSEIQEMAEAIRATFTAGGRLFLCGCGATGRLSLALETLWREAQPLRADQVYSFMAGGDHALIRSIEKFEDHFDYGSRQLRDAGFREGDLLIASTEGGETPFVIGAAEEATRLSGRRPFFQFCNPPDLLARTAERSKRILENPRIRSISFETGPMALAGSTRLQASSVLMAAAGVAMFSTVDGGSPLEQVQTYLVYLERANFTTLSPLIEAEAAIYRKGELCVHETNDYGITVVTDTTERTPTFSLLPFESLAAPSEIPCWTYLSVTGARDPRSAWQKLLHRDPRALEWDGFKEKYGLASVLSFDFSEETTLRRGRLAPVHIYEVKGEGEEIYLKLEGLEARFRKPASLLSQHLFLKAALNFASTLVMGRLNRFESNLMLYVRATNYKLIDRSIRYVRFLLEDAGFTHVSYEEICENLFEIMPRLKPDEPIVLLTFRKLVDKYGSRS